MYQRRQSLYAFIELVFEYVIKGKHCLRLRNPNLEEFEAINTEEVSKIPVSVCSNLIKNYQK